MNKYLPAAIVAIVFVGMAAGPFNATTKDDLLMLQRFSDLQKEVNTLRIQLVTCQEDKEQLQKQLNACTEKCRDFVPNPSPAQQDGKSESKDKPKAP